MSNANEQPDYAWREVEGTSTPLAVAPGFCANMLGVNAYAAGNFAAAEGFFRHAVKLSPDVAEIHCNHGMALAALGRPGDAIAALDRALAINPNYKPAHDALQALQS